jgi:RNA polymerase sigma-70 factor (ECF subfamily)
MNQATHSGGDLRSAEAEALKQLPGDAALALRTLSEDLQITIYYADIEGYRNTEIAEMLGIPVGTVASRLHRGRTRLRELLEEDS